MMWRGRSRSENMGRGNGKKGGNMEEKREEEGSE